MPNALLSVYDKSGIVEFVQELIKLGWSIFGSRGTANHLKENGIQAIDIATIVGGGPILGHRVVTLSREIHAALLAKDTPEDNTELQKLGIPRIDLVCVDLYPLSEAIAKPGATRESVIENTDIGGPTLLRSAAKGRRIVIGDAANRQLVFSWIKEGMPDKDTFLDALVARAEMIVANYCLSSARYHSQGNFDGFIGTNLADCKGENAWQKKAALYSANGNDPLALPNFKLLGGSPSYNNWCDLDRGLQTLTHIAAGFHFRFGAAPYIALGCKHGNPCGAAFGSKPNDVLKQALFGDPQAIFGGFVFTNFYIGDVDVDTLLYTIDPDKKLFLSGIVTPQIAESAITKLQRQDGSFVVWSNPALATLTGDSLDKANRFRYVRGGWLIQSNYTHILDLQKVQKFGEATLEQEKDMILAWAVGATSNSNTVTLVKDRQLIGNGVGQQDRVGACELAIQKAQEACCQITGAIAYSDSFFPFADGPGVLAEHGVAAILTCSGSKRDQEVIDFCQKNHIVLYMIPVAEGRGFFGH